jgi:hypothetical protein
MMKNLSNLATFYATILAVAALPVPSFADTAATTSTGSVCAVINESSTGLHIEINNVGTAPVISCHSDSDTGICDEAFSVCVTDPRTKKQVFAIGAQGTTAYNLTPFVAPDLHPTAIPHINPILDPQANPSNLCRPFVQTLVLDNGKLKPVVMFLKPLDNTSDPLVYDLDDPNGDGMHDEDEALPPGTLIQVVMDNKPVKGSCLGVRTTFQIRKGFCKLCKVRKYYNTCSSNQQIMAIREFERPCMCGFFSAGTGPRKFDTAITVTKPPLTGGFPEIISLRSLDNTGVTPGTAAAWYKPSGAGSVSVGNPFVDEFCKCPLTPRFTASRINSCLLDSNSKDDDENQMIDNPEEVHRWLEVLLSYSPGGVTLKPGMEKLVTFCVSID